LHIFRDKIALYILCIEKKKKEKVNLKTGKRIRRTEDANPYKEWKKQRQSNEKGNHHY
jgi:hypothetical protein